MIIYSFHCVQYFLPRIHALASKCFLSRFALLLQIGTAAKHASAAGGLKLKVPSKASSASQSVGGLQALGMGAKISGVEQSASAESLLQRQVPVQAPLDVSTDETQNGKGEAATAVALRGVMEALCVDKGVLPIYK